MVDSVEEERGGCLTKKLLRSLELITVFLYSEKIKVNLIKFRILIQNFDRKETANDTNCPADLE